MNLNRKTTVLIALSLFAFPALRAADASQTRMDDKHRAFFKDNCTECHNEKKQKGKLRLDDISFTLDTIENADRWQKILNEINSGDMPPEDAKQPEKLAKTDFLDSLSRTLVTARKSLGDVCGKITMRRLNRREYKNTIRDLLGIDLRVNELPADGGAGTFDTVGSSLFMSSDQFEQYLALGRQALEEHFARIGKAQTFKTHHEPEEFANKQVSNWVSGFKQNYERYQQWTAALDAVAGLPENAALAAELRGLDHVKKNPSSFYSEWMKQKKEPSPTKFGFRDGDDACFAKTVFDQHHRYHTDYLALPHKDTGTYLTIYEVHEMELISALPKWPAGNYTLRVRIAALDDAPKERRFIEVFQRGQVNTDMTVISSHQVTGTMALPQTLEIPVNMTSTSNREFAIREKQPNTRSAAFDTWKASLDKTGTGPKPALWIDWIEIEGPIAAGQAVAATKTIKERREVEEHANAMVGGTYNGYYKEGYSVAKAYLDSDRSKPPSAFGKGINDEQEATFRVQVFEEHGPTLERYLNDPLTKNGAYLTIYDAHTEEVITLPPDQPSGWLTTKHAFEQAEPGDYVLRFRIGAVKGTPKERHFVELGSRIKKDEFSLMQTFQISGSTDAPQVIEVPVIISANGPRTFVLQEKRDVKLDFDWYQATRKESGVGPVNVLWIDWVEWEGPLNSADKKAAVEPVLFANTSGASEHDHARAIIEKFATRAFRGKEPGEAFIEKLAALYDARRKAGDAFEVALKDPLSVVLASPGFLYLQEPGQEKKPRTLTDLELATRLSYFLWSAPPDVTLLALAKNNTLHQPAVLAREVDRLIADARSSEFVSGFVHQWLSMERLDFFQFDTKQFRDFDESARAAARREVYETFAHLLRSNGSLTRLLKSDEIFINGLLATYYGIEGVSGDEFQKVKLPADSPRGGLLGMAAIHAMGSNGQVSSPVERGAWVLRKLLHEPPPPAPPNVPQLSRLEGKLLNTRERLAAHMEEPQCAQCHRKIDPIGFGLENFNAAGKWRTEETYEKPGVGKKTWPIEPAGALYNGPAFKDYFQLRDQIAAKPEKFARGFTEALIEYAMGRPFGFVDEDLAADVVKQAQGKEFAMREFVQALVTSRNFQSK
ncbi:hypothetical protein BH11VER1_BH11VER1_09090 [soil metagenome]